jgi:hypothetical protein
MALACWGGGAADVGGVAQDRIDDERQAAVIGADLEGYLAVWPGDEGAGHGLAHAVDLLVQEGGLLVQVAGGGMHDQAALAVRGDALGAFDLEADLARVGPRLDGEVVLEAALGAGMVGQVDAGVDALELDLGEVGHVGVPLAGVGAEEVVGLGGQLVQALDVGAGVGADQAHADDVAGGLGLAGGGLVQVEDGLALAGEEEGVALAASQEGDLGVGLALVGLELDRQLAVSARRGGSSAATR